MKSRWLSVWGLHHPPSPISDEDDLRHATAALSVHTDLRLLGHVLMGP